MPPVYGKYGTWVYKTYPRRDAGAWRPFAELFADKSEKMWGEYQPYVERTHRVWLQPRGHATILCQDDSAQRRLIGIARLGTHIEIRRTREGDNPIFYIMLKPQAVFVDPPIITEMRANDAMIEASKAWMPGRQATLAEVEPAVLQRILSLYRTRAVR